MSVRQSLLAILRQGPCYGSQLRSEFERRTGGARGLNVGQIYNTLERLERDGLVRRGEADHHGHVFWHITDAGAHDADGWLHSPAPVGAGPEDLAMKVALAATLPGVEIRVLLDAQRAQTTARLKSLRAAQAQKESASDPARAASVRVVGHAEVLALESQLRWLDEVERMLRTTPDAVQPLSEERPRRGRPTRTESAG